MSADRPPVTPKAKRRGIYLLVLSPCVRVLVLAGRCVPVSKASPVAPVLLHLFVFKVGLHIFESRYNMFAVRTRLYMLSLPTRQLCCVAG